nr:hypothetical protein [Tanacetum cinerariifolium]
VVDAEHRHVPQLQCSLRRALGTPHRSDDGGLAAAGGRGGSGGGQRRLAGPASGGQPQPVQRADHQLRAVGVVGAGRIQHSHHPVIAHGAAQTAARKHGRL